MKKSLIAVCLVASVGLAVTSCDSNNPGETSATLATTSQTEGTKLTPVRSPSKFGEAVRIDANVKPAPDARTVVVGSRGFTATKTGIAAFDLATGISPWSADLGSGKDASSTTTYPTGPVMSDDGKHVFAAVSATQPGSGTTKARSGVKVAAVDTSSGDVTEIGFLPNETLENPTAVLSSGDVVLVVVGVSTNLTGPMNSSITAFDSTSHKQLWQLKDAADPTIVDGAVLAMARATPSGTSLPTLVSVDLKTGAQRWTSGSDEKSAITEVKAVGLSTGETATTVLGYGDKKKRTEIRDSATGAVKRKVADVELVSPVRDGSMVFDLGSSVGALDGATLQTKWMLPTDSRTAPSNPVLFGGLIYGGVGANESVVIDGNTGQDKTTGVRGRVVAVNEYGIVIADAHGLAFLPATG